jgi:hypothetical protein
MSSKRSQLYTAPGHPEPLTIAQIAAVAACKYSWAHEHVRANRPIAGHVWTDTGEKTPFAEKIRKPRAPVLLTADGDPTPRTYAELSAMAGFKNPRTVYVQVSQRRPICGRVYQSQNKVDNRGAGGGRPCGDWRKSREAPSPPAPPAEPRRFAMAWETVDELLPVNPMRLQAVPDAPTGVTLG